MKPIHIIGSASGWGAQIRTTGQGPDVLWDEGLLGNLLGVHHDVLWAETLYPEHPEQPLSQVPCEKTLPELAPFVTRLSQSVSQTIETGAFPLVVGGDHSCAIGTWSGVIKAHNAAGDFGLIWFDAHMDSHTPQTTPSHAYHGMPAACLLGYGEKKLVNLEGFSPKIRPEHLVFLGVRSFESGEEALLKKLGVKIFYMEDIQEKGFEACWKEALSIASSARQGFGMTFDLDGFDPLDAPGVGSPAEGGLHPAEVLPIVKGAALNPKCCGLEIVELNPPLDHNYKTSRLAIDLATTLFSK